MGTPEFAATILKGLAAWPGGDVVAVYTRPDKPAGRGHVLSAPPVKVLAQSLGIPVFQPANFRNEADIEELRGLCPDILAVAAYGCILPQAVLDIPRIAPINVHASLLPLYRGAAPIQRAVMDGRKVTGISIMRMEAGLDTGPVLSQKALGIGYDETAGLLHDQLAELGRDLLCESLDALIIGELALPGLPQDDALATYAPKLEKKDGMIDWNQPVHDVHAHIRGVTPWPGAQSLCLVGGRDPLHLLITPGRPGPALEKPITPGTIGGLCEEGLGIACSDAWYIVSRLQVRGKKSMDARSFWNGYLQGKGITNEFRLHREQET